MAANVVRAGIILFNRFTTICYGSVAPFSKSKKSWAACDFTIVCRQKSPTLRGKCLNGNVGMLRRQVLAFVSDAVSRASWSDLKVILYSLPANLAVTRGSSRAAD
jgi:hypothetical protein